MKQENQRPLTVEDLLRLKRAERPNRDFWTRFDEELRTKQLVALVRREPWWRRLPSWHVIFRYRVAMSAAAILALSFVTARQFRGQATVSTPVAIAPAATGSAVTVNFVPTAPALADAAVLPAFDVRTNEAPETVSIEAVEEPKPAVGRSHMVSLLGGVSGPNAPELIAASLAATEATEPGVNQSMFGFSNGFEGRALPARVASIEPREPLTSMRHPSEERRRSLAQATLAMSSQMDAFARLGAPVTRKLSLEDRVYEEPRGRLKVGGDTGSFNTTLKF